MIAANCRRLGRKERDGSWDNGPPAKKDVDSAILPVIKADKGSGFLASLCKVAAKVAVFYYLHTYQHGFSL